MKTAKMRRARKAFIAKPSHISISNPELLSAIAVVSEGQGTNFVLSRMNHPEIIAMLLGEIAAGIEEKLAPLPPLKRRRHRGQIAKRNR